VVYIYSDVHELIVKCLGQNQTEHGGILGARPGEAISEFYFDYSGKSTKDSYTPDCDRINDILENEWFPKGVYMVGLIHSHDASCIFPSCGDLLYAERIYRSLDIDDDFYIPIFNIETSQIHWYSIKKQVDGSLKIKEEQVKYQLR